MCRLLLSKQRNLLDWENWKNSSTSNTCDPPLGRLRRLRHAILTSFFFRALAIPGRSDLYTREVWQYYYRVAQSEGRAPLRIQSEERDVVQAREGVFIFIAL